MSTITEKGKEVLATAARTAEAFDDAMNGIAADLEPHIITIDETDTFELPSAYEGGAGTLRPVPDRGRRRRRLGDPETRREEGGIRSPERSGRAGDRPDHRAGRGSEAQIRGRQRLPDRSPRRVLRDGPPPQDQDDREVSAPPRDAHQETRRHHLQAGRRQADRVAPDKRPRGPCQGQGGARVGRPEETDRPDRRHGRPEGDRRDRRGHRGRGRPGHLQGRRVRRAAA